jgi:hypothetical protein
MGDHLRPRDVVALRSAACRDLSEPGWLGGLADFVAPDNVPSAREQDEWLARVITDALGNADLYLIGPEMLDLVGEAATTLPDYVYSESDLPSGEGFCVFATPIRVDGDKSWPFIGFSWCRINLGSSDDDSQIAVHVTWWGRSEDMRGYNPADGPYPTIIPGLQYMAHQGEHWVKTRHGTPAGGNNTAAWLATFWRISQEEWVSVTRRTPGAESKRAARQRRAPSDVRVVTLRRPADEGPEGKGGGGNYSHRWWVKGHWRQQWYPQQQRHAPRWVQGHIKGPEDKPFVAKETVNVLRR